MRRRPAPPSVNIATLPTTRHHSRLADAGLGSLLLLSVVVLYCAVRLILADANSFQAERFVSHWRSLGNPPSLEAWTVARGAAERAITLSPVDDSARYHRLGEILEWRYRDRHPGYTEARDHRLAALDAYRDAARLRPTWPYAWARVASIKAALLAFDTEFDRAASNALRLGASRSRINLRIARLGLFAWHELDDTQRDRILDAAQRGFAQNPRQGEKLIDYARTIHLDQVVCGALRANSPHHAAGCGIGPAK